MQKVLAMFSIFPFLFLLLNYVSIATKKWKAEDLSVADFSFFACFNINKKPHSQLFTLPNHLNFYISYQLLLTICRGGL